MSMNVFFLFYDKDPINQRLYKVPFFRLAGAKVSNFFILASFFENNFKFYFPSACNPKKSMNSLSCGVQI
jgi:hypothetical protein